MLCPEKKSVPTVPHKWGKSGGLLPQLDFLPLWLGIGLSDYQKHGGLLWAPIGQAVNLPAMCSVYFSGQKEV